ncbi:unnamed protein product, partial [Amoebophrya sp. A120]|eukprot:GSA120T00024406001.1
MLQAGPRPQDLVETQSWELQLKKRGQEESPFVLSPGTSVPIADGDSIGFCLRNFPQNSVDPENEIWLPVQVCTIDAVQEPF